MNLKYNDMKMRLEVTGKLILLYRLKREYIKFATERVVILYFILKLNKWRKKQNTLVKFIYLYSLNASHHFIMTSHNVLLFSEW